MTPPELAYSLYHALVAAGHGSSCPSLDAADGPCRCGRTAALAGYEALREGPRSPILSLALTAVVG